MLGQPRSYTPARARCPAASTTPTPTSRPRCARCPSTDLIGAAAHGQHLPRTDNASGAAGCGCVLQQRATRRLAAGAGPGLGRQWGRRRGAGLHHRAHCNKCAVGQLPQKWGEKWLEKPKGYPAAVSLCRPPGMGGKQTLNNKISVSVGRPWRTRRGGRARARRAGRRGGRARGAVTACSSSWQEYKEGISLQL